MDIVEFKLEIENKCKLECIQIHKFDYFPDKKELRIELKYEIDSMQIPEKFNISTICFSKQIVNGTINKDDFETFIKTFHI